MTREPVELGRTIRTVHYLLKGQTKLARSV